MKRSDGTLLVVLPHDCRQVFASEHLNNNTPVHVIQALLGHATIDMVMVYAKRYPRNLVEEYRKAVRGLYNTFHGTESLKNPTAGEWLPAGECATPNPEPDCCARGRLEGMAWSLPKGT